MKHLCILVLSLLLLVSFGCDNSKNPTVPAENAAATVENELQALSVFDQSSNQMAVNLNDAEFIMELQSQFVAQRDELLAKFAADTPDKKKNDAVAGLTIHVPEDFLTIADAVTAAPPFTKIQISGGNYSGYVVVDDSKVGLEITGEGTVNFSSGMYVTANNVKIHNINFATSGPDLVIDEASGVQVKDCNFSGAADLIMSGATNCNIKHNYVTDDGTILLGFFSAPCTRNVIDENTGTGITYLGGVYVGASSYYNAVKSNYCINNSGVFVTVNGITLDDGAYLNLLEDNVCNSNTGVGIYLAPTTHHNVVKKNTVRCNDYLGDDINILDSGTSNTVIKNNTGC
ncbi:MAG: hypothetical protein DWQ05_00510 [Calditrichaeota bacterium]|nr:MAG: hypothetical protein DWQ05_00510 [Calditrichota bacterium]